MNPNSPNTTANTTHVFPKKLALLCASASLLFLVGCKTPSHLTAFATENYGEAKTIALKSVDEDIVQAEQKIANKNSGKDYLLPQMQAGHAAFWDPQSTDASRYFEVADHSFREWDAERLRTGAGVTISMLSNEKAIPYKGKIYERIMIGAYSGLAKVETGNLEEACTEFRRMGDWQSDAVERFAAEIDKAAAANAKKEAESENAQKGMATLASFGISQEKLISDHAELQELVSDNAEFAPYKNYLNPYATWLAGIASTLQGFNEEARNYLREASGMVPESKQIAHDFMKVHSTQAGVAENYVWVIVENGICPQLIEQKIRIPIPLGEHAKAALFTMAYPKLQTVKSPLGSFYVEADGYFYGCEIICDMDRIVAAEYEKALKPIIAREIGRALIKVGIQATANVLVRKENGWVQFVTLVSGMLASELTTAADTRSWAELPKNIHVIGLRIPADRTLVLGGKESDFSGDKRLSTFLKQDQEEHKPGQPTEKVTVQIPNCKNAIVHVRVPEHITNKTSVRVIPIN